MELVEGGDQARSSTNARGDNAAVAVALEIVADEIAIVVVGNEANAIGQERRWMNEWLSMQC
jgi:hypothetical protein